MKYDKTLRAIFFIMMVTLLVIMTGATIVAITQSQIKSQSDLISLRDVNMLLKHEGYKIYFRITEEGQLSLVHPR